MGFDCKILENKLIQLALGRVEKAIGDFEPERIHWVSGDKFLVDESEIRCYRCAKRKSRELINKYRKLFEVNCSSSIDESDICEHCHDCGKLLAYDLTESGVEEELDHYLEDPVRIDLTEDQEAYHLRAILDCYNDYEKHKGRILELARLILKHNFWYKVNYHRINTVAFHRN